MQNVDINEKYNDQKTFSKKIKHDKDYEKKLEIQYREEINLLNINNALKMSNT